MTTLRFRPEVADDLATASDWYDRQRGGLGAEFLGEVQRCLCRVAETPLLFMVVHRRSRRALVERFPYGVFFVVEGDQVTVCAILHAHRDPSAWRARVKE